MSAVPPELDHYLAQPDPTVSWRNVGQSGRGRQIVLRSGTWHGIAWDHDIVLVEPSAGRRHNTAILYITGWDPNPLDFDEAARLADLSGMPVAHLFQIPAQPIFDLTEDDLIAETFVRYLETGDPTWPLLFPMARAGLTAMDALADVTASDRVPLTEFVVTGGSKRGWTAWIVAAAGHPRLRGIAPMVIDNLNLTAQIALQQESWSAPSEMISPYTRRGLHEAIYTEAGQRLASMVDPYSYRSRITTPTLIVNGANDRYWAVDALSRYWDELQEHKWVCTVPNEGHMLGDKEVALRSIAAFARACARELHMPVPFWGWDERRVELSWFGHAPEVCRLWVADSESRDFRDSEWAVVDEAAGEPPVYLSVPETGRHSAAFAEFNYSIAGSDFTLSSVVRVIPASTE